MSSPSEPLGPPYGQEGAYAAHAVPAADAPRTTASDQQPPGAYPPGAYPPSATYPPGPSAPTHGYAEGPPRPPSPPRNDLAVWSLVLGLLGVLGCVFFTGVPAVVVGGNARRAVAAGQADNEGLATAGIVLGWVATALGVIVLVTFGILLLLPLLFLGFAVPFMGSVP
ncbi:DUF4190 domain-containing protein [Cellulomonas sp. zg-ZUI222]|uniref:DUF4190 domain-containing protein n=1 Tax=Cellulomonas wangleii TaxID=2816956 RepID=UPI001A944AD8|nr:DUF4190 domain-containing protein [Cellulomonas wangleii]MBO0920873.1 DUF4190 domain-containing protein [Cellulomonas wangleii]